MPRLGPPPDRTPFLDRTNLVTWPWIKWAQQVFLEIIGKSDIPLIPLADEGSGGSEPSSLAQTLAAAATFADTSAKIGQIVSSGEDTSPSTVFPFFVPDEIDHRWIADTHANRALYDARAYPAGSLYYETDRFVLYVATNSAGGRVWQYAAGQFYTASTPATVSSATPALGVPDAGLLMQWSTYSRVYRWSGTAWERAPGEDPGNGTTRMFGDFSGAPGTGWALCDGSVVTVTNNDGTTGSFTTPNFSGYYAKAAAAYTGTQIAATVPTGTVTSTFAGAPMANHTHNMPISLDTGTPQIYISDSYGTGSPTITAKALIAATANTTAGLAPLEVSDASAGTPAGLVASGFTGTTAGEPAHIDILKYVRL